MNTVPDLDNALYVPLVQSRAAPADAGTPARSDLKLSVSADQFADIKRIRSAYTSRKQLDDYLREDEQAWVDTLASIPSSSVRAQTPPARSVPLVDLADAHTCAGSPPRLAAHLSSLSPRRARL